jgi:hypothetical protein
MNKPSSKQPEQTHPTSIQLDIEKIDSIISMYKPAFEPALIFDLLYYILQASAIMPQYFTLFKSNAGDCSVKLVFYSLVVSFTTTAKNALRYNQKRDPLNELRLRNVLKFTYYFCIIYPLSIVWDLYDNYTPLKVVLLIY